MQENQENTEENTEENTGLKEIQITGSEDCTTFTPKFIKPKKVFYRDMNVAREDIDKEWEMVDRPDSVHCLLFEEDTGDFIMVQQVRIPVLVNDPESKGIVTELCAGLIDNPELSPEATMAKELREELGYVIPEEQLMHIKTFKSAVGSTGNNAYYYAAVVNKDTERCDVAFDGDECIIERRVHAQEINNFLSSDENMDTGTALTVLGFYLNLINMSEEANQAQMTQEQQNPPGWDDEAMQAVTEAVQNQVQEQS